MFLTVTVTLITDDPNRIGEGGGSTVMDNTELSGGDYFAAPVGDVCAKENCPENRTAITNTARFIAASTPMILSQFREWLSLLPKRQ
jgi:hypothetical protein